MVYLIKQYITFLYLFDFIIKKINSINNILEHLLFEIIGKKFNKKKALFNCFNKF